MTGIDSAREVVAGNCRPVACELDSNHRATLSMPLRLWRNTPGTP